MERYWFINTQGQVDTRVFASHHIATIWFARNGVSVYDTDLDAITKLVA